MDAKSTSIVRSLPDVADAFDFLPLAPVVIAGLRTLFLSPRPDRPVNVAKAEADDAADDADDQGAHALSRISRALRATVFHLVIA